MKATLSAIKAYLEWSGWLQYIIPLIPTLILSLLAGITWLIGFPRAATSISIAPAALLAIAIFDLFTSKFKLRPSESRPKTNEHLDMFELMHERSSCRSFQTRFMLDEDRNTVLQLVQEHTQGEMFGPTPVRFEYIQGAMSVWPVVNASEFLVAIVPKAYDRRSVVDVGRTLQRIVMGCTRQGLGTCWIGPGADQASVKSFLGDRFDNERDAIICVCAVGYRSMFWPLFLRFARLFRERLPIPELFFTDKSLKVPAVTNSAALTPYARNFEACQQGPSSYNAQPTRGVLRTNEKGALVGIDFFSTTTSQYYAPVAVGIWLANWELGVDALGLKGRFVSQPPPPKGELVVAPHHDVTWEPVRAAADMMQEKGSSSRRRVTNRS